jgi:hypothetical protein
VVAGVLCSGLALAGCGGSSKLISSSSTTPRSNGVLNTKQVAKAIVHSIFVKRHLHATVICPPNVPEEQGHTFTCIATTHSHHKPVHTTFTVFQRNGHGGVYYQSPQ